MLLFGSQKIGFSSIGPLGILCLAITAKIIWLKVDEREVHLKGKNYVVKNFFILSGLF